MKSKKFRLYIFFTIVALQCLAANFAHPITPTLIHNLGLPDYSFGILFAAMAFSNFLFSPMWGKLVHKYGSKTILGICCIGYGIGQAMFAMFSTLLLICFARIFAGFFVGGILVSYMTYILSNTDESQRGKSLALLATFSSVFAAFGYLIGGILGSYSIYLTFIVQVISLIICGILFYTLLNPDEIKPTTFTLKDINPLRALLEGKQYISKSFIYLLLAVFITSVATTGFDQSFNYYIKDIFNFSSSYNGIIKAVIGVITLACNMTICVWLFKHTNTKISVIFVLLGCSTSLLLLILTKSIIIFIIFALVFFAFNALYLPLLQDITLRSSDSYNSSIIAGIYNATKSLGMIFGALYAGFVYGFNALLPFVIAAILFVLAIGVILLYLNMTKKMPSN